MISRILPDKKHIVVIMTPREASMVEQSLLDPDGFPWMDSEHEVVALNLRKQLHDAVGLITQSDFELTLKEILSQAAEKNIPASEPVKEDTIHPQQIKLIQWEDE